MCLLGFTFQRLSDVCQGWCSSASLISARSGSLGSVMAVAVCTHTYTHSAETAAVLNNALNCQVCTDQSQELPRYSPGEMLPSGSLASACCPPLQDAMGAATLVLLVGVRTIPHVKCVFL